MQISPFCRRLALHEVFREYGVETDGSLPYHDLQRSWADTGLRRSDLDQAINDALGNGDLLETWSHEGRLAILTASGHRKARQAPATVHELEQQRLAETVLQRAKSRRRLHGLLHGRLRAGDSIATH